MVFKNKWVLSYLYKVLVRTKLALFLSVLLSLFYTYSLFRVGNKVQFEDLSKISVILFGAGSVLIIRFFLNLTVDFMAIKLSALSQLELINLYENKINFLKNKYNNSQLQHRTSSDFLEFSEALVQAVLHTLTQGLVTLLLSAYLVFKFKEVVPQVLLFLLIGVGLSLFLHFINKNLNNKKAYLDEEVFRFQKNIISGFEFLKISKKISNWKIKYESKLIKLLIQERKISLVHHITSTLNWGAKYVFILLIISPLVSSQSLPAQSVYWLYVMLGMYTYLFWIIFRFGQVRVYSQRINELFESVAPIDRRIRTGELAIVVKSADVYFGPNQQKEGLKNLNFNWAKGERIWIEGLSGAGKTTLIKALLGLHYNFTGSFTLPDETHSFGYLSQDPFFFEGENLRENLFLDKITGNELHLIEQLNLTSFFKAIDWNLEVNFGSEGFEPSKGQKSRLALLRELIREPDVLFLDEPTSHVDEATAKSLIKLVSSYRLDKLTVICEHNNYLRNLFNPSQIIEI